MEGKKSEQIKIYMITGLLLVAAIVAYFRFIHKKAPRGAETTLSTVATAPLDVPKVEKKMIQNTRRSNVTINEPLRPSIRDIFAPLIRPKKKVKSRPLRPRPSRRKLSKPTLSKPTLWKPTLSKPKPSRPKLSRPPPTLKLMGVIVGGGDPIAIINGQFVRTGERIGNYEVVRIGEKEVFLRSGNKRAKLKLLTK